MNLPMNPEPGTDVIAVTDLWDRTNPRSIINLVQPGLGRALLEAAKVRGDLFEMDERTLYKQLRSDGKLPTATDNRLRMNFWQEYDRAQATNRDMEIVAIYAGVCSNNYFMNRYLLMPEKVAWMACAPASYSVIMEEALAFGIEQLRDILEMPMVDGKGRINVKLAELKAKITDMLIIRVKGAVTQKLEQTSKNMNLSITTSDATVAKQAMLGSMDAIEKRLKELERRDRTASPREIVIEDASGAIEGS
jgi:hypothetical protein